MFTGGEESFASSGGEKEIGNSENNTGLRPAVETPGFSREEEVHSHFPLPPITPRPSPCQPQNVFPPQCVYIVPLHQIPSSTPGESSTQNQIEVGEISMDVGETSIIDVVETSTDSNTQKPESFQ